MEKEKERLKVLGKNPSEYERLEKKLNGRGLEDGKGKEGSLEPSQIENVYKTTYRTLML